MFLFSGQLSSILRHSFVSMAVTTILSTPVFAQAIMLNANFAPNPMEIQAKTNGSMSAISVSKKEQTATGSCDGFIKSQPNHVVTLTNFFPFLKISISSPQDTTLIVSGPGGIWCNDDSESKNPEIAGQWQPGTYNIWVGGYKADLSIPYQIKFERNN